VESAIRLNPYHPDWYTIFLVLLSMACVGTARAATLMSGLDGSTRGFHAISAACLCQAGLMDNARQHVAEISREMADVSSEGLYDEGEGLQISRGFRSFSERVVDWPACRSSDNLAPASALCPVGLTKADWQRSPDRRHTGGQLRKLTRSSRPNFRTWHFSDNQPGRV